MNFSGVNVESLAGKALRLPLRFIPKNAPMRILQGPLRGKKWMAGAADHGCWLGSYEFEKQQVFAEAVKPGDTVYDLGANAGFYSLLASTRTGPAGRVVAFEPYPKNVANLRKHLELNLVANCTVVDAAVSSFDGYSNFADGPSCSTGRLAGGCAQGIRVRTVTLDRLVGSGQIPPPDIIKCDVEGGEYDALRGGLVTLRDHAPLIFLATHGAEAHERCCELLAELGYSIISMANAPIDNSDELIAARKH
jgi:FkbM family methyltransferase